MAFWKFTGTEDEFFPSLGLTSRPGEVYDFGDDDPPREPLAKGGQLSPIPASKWTSDPGPATDFNVVQASDVKNIYVSPAAIVKAGDAADLISKVASVTSGEIFIPRGTYTISSQLIPNAGVTLRGEGNLTKIVCANSFGHNPAIHIGTDDVTVRDFLIDGNKANQTADLTLIDFVAAARGAAFNIHSLNANGYGLHAGPGSTDIRFEGCIVEGPRDEGIEFQGASHGTIVGNVVLNAGKNAIYTWGNTAAGYSCSDVTITGNLVRNHGQNAGASGIRVDDGATSVTVVSNVVDGAGTASSVGIGVFSSTANAVSQVTVSGNTIRGTNVSQAGLLVQVASNVTVNANVINGLSGLGVKVGTSVSDVVLSGNNIVSCSGNGIYSQGVSMAISNNVIKSCGGTTNDSLKVDGGSSVTVSGNRISSGGGAGVLLSGVQEFAVTGNICYANRTSGVYVLDSNNGTVTGNTCRANGRVGVSSVLANGITVFKNTATCSGVIVTGNRCYDDQGTKTQAYGVRVYQAVDNCVLGPNLLTGNATADKLVDATATNITTVTPV